MALKMELDARAKKMENILGEVNTALGEKNGTAVKNFGQIPAAIASLGGAEIRLQNKTVTENGVYTADSGYDGLGEVSVEVAGSGGIEAGIVYDEITDDGKAIRATVYGSALPQYALAGQDALVEATLPQVIDIVSSSAFYSCSALTFVELPDIITAIDGNAFYNCRVLELPALPAALTSIGTSAFYNCKKLAITEIPAGLLSTKSSAFSGCTALTNITFMGTPDSLNSTTFLNCSAITVINVPWAQGAVSGAPWGATNATINYNYTGE